MSIKKSGIKETSCSTNFIKLNTELIALTTNLDEKTLRWLEIQEM